MLTLKSSRFQQIKQALDKEWDCETVPIGSGGAIPVVNEFKEQLGIETFLIGFSNPDDRIHSPNEKYNLTSFRKGIRSWIRILFNLA